MAALQAFQPTYGTGKTGTASTTSATVSIDVGADNDVVVVTNKDAAIAFYVRLCRSTDTAATRTATSADYCVLPGQQVPLSRSMNHDTVAIVADSGTPAYHMICGKGF